MKTTFLHSLSVLFGLALHVLPAASADESKKKPTDIMSLEELTELEAKLSERPATHGTLLEKSPRSEDSAAGKREGVEKARRYLDEHDALWMRSFPKGPDLPGVRWMLGVAVEGGGDAGLRVTMVEPKSAAAEGGLKAGDVLRAINGIRLNNFHQLKLLVQATEGQKVRVIFERDGKKMSKAIAARKVNPWSVERKVPADQEEHAPVPQEKPDPHHHGDHGDHGEREDADEQEEDDEDEVVEQLEGIHEVMEELLEEVKMMRQQGRRGR